MKKKVLISSFLCKLLKIGLAIIARSQETRTIFSMQQSIPTCSYSLPMLPVFEALYWHEDLVSWWVGVLSDKTTVFEIKPIPPSCSLACNKGGCNLGRIRYIFYTVRFYASSSPIFLINRSFFLQIDKFSVLSQLPRLHTLNIAHTPSYSDVGTLVGCRGLRSLSLVGLCVETASLEQLMSGTRNL